jgi:hypothetical protein
MSIFTVASALDPMLIMRQIDAEFARVWKSLGKDGAPGTQPPLMDSLYWQVGVSTNYSREDHIHPSDTSRVSVGGDTMSGPLTINGSLACVGNSFAVGANNQATIYGDATNSIYFQATSTAYLAYNGVNTQWNFYGGGPLLGFWRGSDGALVTYSYAYKPGGGSWADSSDERIKTVTGDYTSGLDAVRALKPVRYRFKGNDTAEPPAFDEAPVPPGQEQPAARTDPVAPPYENSPHYRVARDGNEFVGLIAQEAETAMPELVTQTAAYIDGQQVTDLRSLHHGPLVFALINAVKELAARSGAAPAPVAFAATCTATLAVVKNTPTKINFDTVEFDTTAAFDAANHRYQPLVAGYYMVNCGCGLVAGSAETYTSIYKNGVEYRRSTTGDSANARLSTLVYLNGTTDYIEGFVTSVANFSTDTSTVLTSFSATLTQAAAA